MNKRAPLLLSFALALVAACDKPSESECKRAVTNIRQLMGTSKMSIDGSQDAAWVRSCRGTAKKTSVTCATNAKTLDALKGCGLLTGQDLDALMAIEQDLERLRAAAAASATKPVDAGVAPLDAGADPIAALADAGTAPAPDAAAAPGPAPGPAAPAPGPAAAPATPATP